MIIQTQEALLGLARVSLSVSHIFQVGKNVTFRPEDNLARSGESNNDGDHKWSETSVLLVALDVDSGVEPQISITK